MSSGTRKRGLVDDSPSAVENGKAKMRKEDEQLLREADPFNSIDDVTSELRSIEGYVGGAKGAVFQTILEKLGKSDALFRKKQGQDIAADPELRFLYKDDVTELRRLIDQHVAKSVRAEFETQLQKMGSEDRLVMKKMNHSENLTLEEVVVEVDRTPFVSIDTQKEELLDNYDDVEIIGGVDGMQNDFSSDPNEEQVEQIFAAEQPNMPEPVEVGPDDAPMGTSNVKDVCVEVVKTRLCFIDPPKEEHIDIPVHAMEVRDVPQFVEPVAPKDEPVEVPICEMEVGVNVSQHVEPEIEPSEVNEQRTNPNVEENVDDDCHEDMASEPIEDPEELGDNSVTSSKVRVKKTNWLCESDDEISDEENSYGKGRKDRQKLRKEILRKFDHLSDRQLIRFIISQRELNQCACDALRFRNYTLLSFVVEPDHTVTLLMLSQAGRRSKMKLEVELQGRDYGYQLVLLIHTVLNGYESRHANFEFKATTFTVGTYLILLVFQAPDYGTALPFERFFQLKKRFCHLNNHISELRINKPELLPLVRYVFPKKLYVSFPSSHLFDNDGTCLVNTTEYLVLSSDEVDNVDTLREKCRVDHIQLAPNSYWSDESVKKALTIDDESNWIAREIVCHYAIGRIRMPHQRNNKQWSKLFSDKRAVYEDVLDKRSIRMRKNTSEKTITFTNDCFSV